MWVRGLKLKPFEFRFSPSAVAPRVGAWIETWNGGEISNSVMVAPRVGAWIETYITATNFRGSLMSHPVWVRGLKPTPPKYRVSHDRASHPVWVRGLKQERVRHNGRGGRRTPCGCVD